MKIVRRASSPLDNDHPKGSMAPRSVKALSWMANSTEIRISSRWSGDQGIGVVNVPSGT